MPKRYIVLKTALDGKDALSEKKVVNFGVKTIAPEAALLAFSNPFTSSLSISVAGNNQEAASLYLTDFTGRTICAQQLVLMT